MTNANSTIKPFKRCPPLDGYHCQTNALAKIFYYHGHPLSEDMLLGLGSGMGFIYWRMRIGEESVVFVGGRGNNKGFFSDVGRRTGVAIRAVSTSSAKRAESLLLSRLVEGEPIMLFGDTAFFRGLTSLSSTILAATRLRCAGLTERIQS